MTNRTGLSAGARPFAAMPDGGFVALGLSVSAFDSTGLLRWTAATTDCPECLISTDANGVVFVPNFSNNRGAISGSLAAFNPNGAVKWTAPIPTLGVAVGSDSLIYTLQSIQNPFEKHLLAVKKESGTIVWSTLVSLNAFRILLDESRQTAYLLGGVGLEAIDLKSHQRKWMLNKPYSYGAIGADGTLYLTPGFDAVGANGELKWSVPSNPGHLTPIIDAKGIIYVVTTGINGEFNGQPSVSAFDLNGQLIWKYMAGAGGGITFANPALDMDGNLYVVERFDSKAAWAITPVKNGVRGKEVASVDADHGRSFLINRSGRVFYPDRGGTRLQFFDSKGLNLSDPWPMLGKTPERSWRF